MEEELNYVTVAFKTDSVSAYEKPKEMETIYDEVKTKDWLLDTKSDNQEKEKKATSCSLLHLLAAGLGIICVALVSVIITFTLHSNAVTSEQQSQNINLMQQNQLLWNEKMDLERQTVALTRDRDALNWTLGVILDYDNFPVNTHCPEKVCKPCLDGWVYFQSKCYMFSNTDYYYYWRSWEGSRDQCSHMKADLVVIESQEEQEFISNHTKYYNDEWHGYWIGLSYKDTEDTWTWVDGSNLTATYWKPQARGYRSHCALTLYRDYTLDNWQKSSCDMRNRWICETRALVKPDEK